MKEIKKTAEQINLCLRYSQDKVRLKELLKELTVRQSVPTLKKYFSDDNTKRNVYLISLVRNNKGTVKNMDIMKIV